MVQGRLTQSLKEIFKNNDFESINQYAVKNNVYFYPLSNPERFYVAILEARPWWASSGPGRVVALGIYGRSVWEHCNIWVTALCSMVKGLGHLVLREIEKQVQILYPDEILYIEANNSALGFYEKMGYQKMFPQPAESGSTSGSVSESYESTFVCKVF